jgi:small GTP-binding protein
MIAQNKKILLVGPPGAGKTTIKKVYFDKKAPQELLQHPLGPSRGVSSDRYSYLNSNLGIFDLAGQENDQWLSNKGKSVFRKTSAILCIFDISNSLESIIEFLIKIFQVKKELNLKSCHIIAFLHKVDKVTPSYVTYKISSLKNFIEKQQSLKDDIRIFETSIKRDFFYNTFSIIADVIKELYDNGIIPVDKDEFNRLSQNFSKIIDNDLFDDRTNQTPNEDLEYDNNNLGLDLKNLENIGLIKQVKNNQYFQLTERAYYLRLGWKQEKLNKIDTKLKSAINNFHILLFLNKTET